MDLSPVVIAIPIYFSLISLELIIQYFTGRKVYRWNDAITNISCGIVQQVSGLFLKIFSIGIYHVIYTYFALFTIPTNWVSLLALFVLVDFFYYWAHRKSHEINLFWGGHVVHHQSEDFNLSVALRQGSFQVIWTSAFYLPLAVLGFNTIDFALMAGLTTIYQFWIHTPYVGKLPSPVELFLNTPSHHRVHHGRDPKYIDKNHAGVFIIWDRMFGTFQEEEETPTYGITKPVRSWNPVWVNLEHYSFMWKEIKKIERPVDKLKYTFYKPGWLPEDMGGYRPAPKVDSTSYRKFTTSSPTLLNYYVLFQFILTIGFTAYVLFNQEEFRAFEIVAGVLLIILTVANLGSLFEWRSWALPIERLRIIIIALSGIVLAYLNSWAFIPALISIFFMIVSLFWLNKLSLGVRHEFEQ